MKTKVIIRLMSAFLLSAMLVTALAACSKKDGNIDDGEKTLEEGGLNGFTLATVSYTPPYSDTPPNLMYVEEAEGDTIKEAVYARNARVNKKYGLELEQTYSDDIIGTIVKITASQDDAYQIANIGGGSCIEYISQNIFDNVLELPYIDLSKEYWNSEIMDQCTVNGFCVGLLGDLTFDGFDGFLSTMYNRPLADDYGIENLYDVVNRGEWTFDRKMTEMKKVITDLDNDGRYGFNDRIGLLYASNNCGSYYGSVGIDFVKKDKEGTFYFDESVLEKAEIVTEKVQQMLCTKGYAVDWLDGDGMNTIIGMIENKQVLFQNMVISQVRRFYREIKTDFGLLPVAKMNEEQDKYYCNAGNPTIIVPASNLNLEKTGFALEALASESADFPNVYFHVCLESKFTRDAESIDMIMLCYRNTCCDTLGYFKLGGLNEALNVILSNKRSFTAVITNYRDAVEEALIDLNMIEVAS